MFVSVFGAGLFVGFITFKSCFSKLLDYVKKEVESDNELEAYNSMRWKAYEQVCVQTFGAVYSPEQLDAMTIAAQENGNVDAIKKCNHCRSYAPN